MLNALRRGKTADSGRSGAGSFPALASSIPAVRRAIIKKVLSAPVPALNVLRRSKTAASGCSSSSVGIIDSGCQEGAQCTCSGNGARLDAFAAVKLLIQAIKMLVHFHRGHRAFRPADDAGGYAGDGSVWRYGMQHDRSGADFRAATDLYIA